jgi:hypothetical protein
MEFDLGSTLDQIARHNEMHPKPVTGCATCLPAVVKEEVMAELTAELGRTPTRAEVGAHPKMIALDAQTAYDLLRFAQYR